MTDIVIEKLRNLILNTDIKKDEVVKLLNQIQFTSSRLMLTKLREPNVDWEDENIYFKDFIEIESVGKYNKPHIINNFANNLLLLKVILSIYGEAKGLESKEDRILFYFEQDLEFKVMIEGLYQRISKEFDENGKKIK